MNANRFYSVSYDAHNNSKVLKLMYTLGTTKAEAFGYWVILLDLLYDEGGYIRLDDEAAITLIAHEFGTTPDDLGDILKAMADVRLIDADAFEKLHTITTQSVLDEIEYHRVRSEVGKMGGRPKKDGKGEKPRPKTST